METKTILRLIIVIISLVVNASCSDNNDIDTTFTNISNENPNNDVIAQTAISFVKSLNEGKATRTFSNLQVKNIQKLNLDNESLTRSSGTINTPEFYSVGMNNNLGTVFLAEKNSTITPLAYFQGENDVNINEILNDTINTFSFIIQMLVEQNIDMKASIKNPATRAVTSTIIERLEPKCKVWWDQGHPFNWYCYTNDGKKALAGCVAIAGAQALTILRPTEPNISSWDAVIAENPTLSRYQLTSTMNEIATLIHEIGVNVNMNYGTAEEGGSGASKSNLIKYFKKKYGIEDYDCKRAIDVLKTKHGVIIIGGYASKTKSGILFWRKTNYHNGHAFIADGYVKYGDNGSKKNDDPYYLHINYGWGNGYANEAYILSGNKKFIDHAEEYSNGKLYQYNLSYATLTYPSEKNW